MNPTKPRTAQEWADWYLTTSESIPIIELVTKAMDQARNQALEDAANVATRNGTITSYVYRTLASRIRALKSK